MVMFMVRPAWSLPVTCMYAMSPPLPDEHRSACRPGTIAVSGSAWLLAWPKSLRQPWKVGAMPGGRKTICPPDERYSLSTSRSALVPRIIWMGLKGHPKNREG